MLTTSLKLADKYNYLEEKFQKAFEFLRNGLNSCPYRDM